MEDALAPSMGCQSSSPSKVLILVVMEDALAHPSMSTIMYGFNSS